MNWRKISKMFLGAAVIFLVCPVGASNVLAAGGAGDEITDDAPADSPGVEISETNFPDEVFRTYVRQFDTDGDGVLSEVEIGEAAQISVENMGISDLTGLEYFTSLQILYCDNNQLTELNVSGNPELYWLNCSGNELTSLDVSGNPELYWLNCQENRLTELNVSGCMALEKLSCYTNQLGKLDVSGNPNLVDLDCSENQLTELDVSQNSSLVYLYCDYNRLTAMDLSNNPEMDYFEGTGQVILMYELPEEGYDLTQLNPAISEEAITNLTGAQINGTVISGYGSVGMITYDYNCGSGFEMDVTLRISTWAEDSVAIDEINFPDDIFRSCVRQFDTDGDGSLTASEAGAARTVNVESMGIHDLSGIEHFILLKVLNCADNELTSLDISKNPTIQEIDCSSNQLTELDVSANTALRYIICDSNELTGIDVSNNPDLLTLSFNDNRVTKVDVSQNPVMDWLDCGGNQISSLDVSANPNLYWLVCSGNQLTALDVSHNPELAGLYCSENRLTELDVSANTNLNRLYCSGNQLAELDVSMNPDLRTLACDGNELTALDVSGNTQLTYFEGSGQRTFLQQIPADSYDLTDLNPLISGAAITNLTGAQLNGTVISGYADGGTITYDYDCGNGCVMDVTLNVTVADETDVPGTSGDDTDNPADDNPGTIPEKDTDSTSGQKPSKTSGGNAGNQQQAVKTGDEEGMLPLLAAAGISALTVYFALVLKKKRVY